MLKALIAAINRDRPAFSIHVGDIKSGSSLCSDEEFERQRAHFSLFEGALVYTPGDNEWTDCHRGNNGSYDPVERLAALRKLFFADERSLGQQPLTLQSQPKLQPAHALWTENRRWQAQGVVVRPATDPEVQAWLQQQGVRAVVLRPDRYIMGVAQSAEQLDSISALLPQPAALTH